MTDDRSSERLIISALKDQFKRDSSMRNELTDGELVMMSSGVCPNCGYRGFALGPRGGASINIECCGCHQRFNVCNIGWAIVMAQRLPMDD